MLSDTVIATGEFQAWSYEEGLDWEEVWDE